MRVLCSVQATLQLLRPRPLALSLLAAFFLGNAEGLAQPATGARSASPRYALDVPARITTPDVVKTRVGTFRFSRGIEAIVRGMSATLMYAICRGQEAGVPPNRGIGITEQRMDARSLFLTPNTTTVYVLQRGCPLSRLHHEYGKHAIDAVLANPLSGRAVVGSASMAMASCLPLRARAIAR